MTAKGADNKSQAAFYLNCQFFIPRGQGLWRRFTPFDFDQ